ncbi:hypothetical protein [Ktedonospora formicarum]|uniref:Uncharacterized protein n=1 Tax=Ktedonospora formicarum TaxID=2778364 RepID=A0A8J3I7M7_9CHLR|nr:hypothetical protein [Ktedonospora formicarum]GHO48608.1 hypothetical protein KSX_67710 [Ktedonospora formicarum]
MPAPNWHEVEERLFAEGKSALLQFMEEHPDEICSFFAYGWIPMDGDFYLFLDTPHNALRMAQDDQQSLLKQRGKMLQRANSWQYARYSLSQDIVEYAANVDLFAYAPYREVYFDGWQEFVSSDAYPEGPERADDYMEVVYCKREYPDCHLACV